MRVMTLDEILNLAKERSLNPNEIILGVKSEDGSVRSVRIVDVTILQEKILDVFTVFNLVPFGEQNEVCDPQLHQTEEAYLNCEECNPSVSKDCTHITEDGTCSCYEKQDENEKLKTELASSRKLVEKLEIQNKLLARRGNEYAKLIEEEFKAKKQGEVDLWHMVKLMLKGIGADWYERNGIVYVTQKDGAQWDFTVPMRRKD